MINHAEEVELKLQKTLLLRRAAAVVLVLGSLVYLIWRLTIINPAAPFCSLFFLLAGCCDFFLACSLVFSSWSHLRRTSPPLTRPYKVDVLIPVYTEPIFMIEFTMIAAKEIDYPHETYLLDDGNRPELKAIAEKHGVHYLARPINVGAKAGNLNHGLLESNAEFVATFDADHIAKRDSLHRLLGFFDDENVAMAQAPQTFYNEDAMIYRKSYLAGSRWNEQSFFYDVSEPSRDAMNGASGVGTGAIYRRSALEDIGGFPTQTLTEDMHVSLLFHKHGWKTVYLNEPVAWGVAAADVPEYTKTRHRWARGNLHGICYENVLFCPGLTWQQRLGYLTVALGLVEGWQQLIYVLLPFYVMIFVASPIIITPWNAFIVIAVPIIQIFFQLFIGGRFVKFFAGQFFAIGRSHLYLAGTLGLFGRRMRWRVSRKNVLGVVNLNLLLPQFIVVTLGFLALLYVGAREGGLWGIRPLTYQGHYLVFVAGSWAIYNMMRAAYWINGTMNQIKETNREYLFEVPVPVLDERDQLIGQATRLSTSEGKAVWLEGKEPEVGRVLKFLFPGFTLPIKIEADRRQDIFSFTCLEPGSRDHLKRSLYSVDWHSQIRRAPHCHRPKLEGMQGPWYPAVVCQTEANDTEPFWGVIQTGETNDARPKMIVSAPMRVGDKVLVKWSQNEAVRERLLVVAAPGHTKYQIPKDLNDRNFSVFEFDLL